MSMKTRREVIRMLADQYKRAKSRNEKSAILDNAVKMLGCHRKHAIRALANPPALLPAKSKRHRPLAYQEAMPVIECVWEALDYPERYDRPEQVEWLNSIYALHDRYFNFCLPTRKLIGKERRGARVKKTFDTAKTPVARLIESGVLSSEQTQRLQAYPSSQDPLTLHNQLEMMLSRPVPSSTDTAEPVEAV
ncbi:hypothetical protein [Thermobacillus composti]|uniref:hypothetical protein n=1 Tax=Thermobacillus composti TaxID=377615 RepID=UPI00069AD11C|nr:hypothetical protein [Thermobacillus composti]